MTGLGDVEEISGEVECDFAIPQNSTYLWQRYGEQ